MSKRKVICPVCKGKGYVCENLRYDILMGICTAGLLPFFNGRYKTECDICDGYGYWYEESR